MTRIQAFLIHLAISLAIFAVLAGWVFFVWYPDFLFITDGGWQGVRLIGFVDLVLGPMLTLVVYKAGKPSLKLDMSAIAAIQLVCLTAGTYVVYSERPLALVYVDGQFYSMSAGDYVGAGVPIPDLSHLPGLGPKRVVVDLPEDVEAQSAVRAGAWQSGVPLRALSDRYVPLTYDLLAVEREAVGYEALAAQDSGHGELPKWLAAHGGRIEDYAFFRFATRYVYSFLAISKERGEIAGYLKTPLPRAP
jgi:hypothetical protein